MKQKKIRYRNGVTLVGGGPLSLRDLRQALPFAPHLVAADGGADRLLASGYRPEKVIGDLDSISASARSRLAQKDVIHVTDQATTDFDKALRLIEAPFLLCLGFAAGRSDHALAVMNTLIRHAQKRAVVLGARDVYFAAPEGELHLKMRRGDRLSLFPFAAVQGKSRGLVWEINGLSFAPDGFIGTSNRLREAEVRLEFDRAGMLVLLPRGRLGAALEALGARRQSEGGRQESPP